MMLLDAHSHLDMYDENELPGVLDALHRFDIFTISVAMDPLTYRRALDIAQRSDRVLPTFGVHPQEAFQYADCLDDLHLLIDTSPMLGEIGLDTYFVEEADRYPAQRRVFEFFLGAARDQDKIVNLHTKGAEAEIRNLLRQYGITRAIVHWYSGPLDVFRQMVKDGLLFTVGPEVLHSDHIRTIARQIPAAQLLTELDNPGGPEWLTGERGMPSLLVDVVHALADLRGTTPQAIVDTVQANFLRLIGDDPRLAGVRARLER